MSKLAIYVAITLTASSLIGCEKAPAGTMLQFSTCMKAAKSSYDIVLEHGKDLPLSNIALAYMKQYKNDCAFDWSTHERKQDKIVSQISRQIKPLEGTEFKNLVYYKDYITGYEYVVGQVEIPGEKTVLNFEYVYGELGNKWIKSGGSWKSNADKAWDELEIED